MGPTKLLSFRLSPIRKTSRIWKLNHAATADTSMKSTVSTTTKMTVKKTTTLKNKTSGPLVIFAIIF